MRSANLPPSGSFFRPPPPSFLAFPPTHPSSGSDQCILVSTVFFFPCADAPAAAAAAGDGSVSGAPPAATATTNALPLPRRPWTLARRRWRSGVNGADAVDAAMRGRSVACARAAAHESSEVECFCFCGFYYFLRWWCIPRSSRLRCVYAAARDVVRRR